VEINRTFAQKECCTLRLRGGKKVVHFWYPIWVSNPITCGQHSSTPESRGNLKMPGIMASAVARAYSGVQGQSPWSGGQGEAPLKLEALRLLDV